ncbi:hypothetical protein GA0115235_108045 [Streptomyces sp. DpondAA-F4a]|nr:hypothetical protein GA0115235_108045 [Streptomyces sp. DpondAA-F4a]
MGARGPSAVAPRSRPSVGFAGRCRCPRIAFRHGREDEPSRAVQPRTQPGHPGTAVAAPAHRTPGRGGGRPARRPPGTEHPAPLLPAARPAGALRPRRALRADGVAGGRPDRHPALHHPHPHRRRRAHPAAPGPAGPRPGAEDLPRRARGGGPGPARRPEQDARRGAPAHHEGAAGRTAHPLAGRRTARPVRRRPLHTAAGPDHPARAVGAGRAGRAHHRRALARPPRRAGARPRRHGPALPRRLRARLGEGHAEVGRTHPAARGLRTAAAPAGHLP